ncbi:uncharacterized protein LOC131843932 [Achroia grisella]|uniref:uncharacterized protein LOC131843932 n=1 Tax=Achroia grisella TaxID=688607 RepID=UPI0027D31B1C|nr:uncharacterized protein LOC131843932 [Achroia grisella]
MVGGGGVAIFLRWDIPYEVVSQSSPNLNGPEHLFIKISLHHTKVLLGVYYSPSLHVNYFDSFDNIISELRPNFDHLIIMGDFNTCLIKNDCRSKMLLSLLHSLNLTLLPLLPTHFPHNGPPSLLDLIITSSPDLVQSHGQFCAVAFSSHDLIYASFKLRTPKRRHRVVLRRNFDAVNIEALQNDLRLADWSPIFTASDVDSKVAAFEHLILSIYDKHAPVQQVRLKHSPAPWLTMDLKALMSRRDRAKIRLRRSSTDSDRQSYITLRNRCNKLCRQARRRHIHSNIENCPPGRLWNYLRTIGIGKRQCGDNFPNLNEINLSFVSPPVNLNPVIKQETLASLSGFPHSHDDPFTLAVDDISSLELSAVTVSDWI